MSTQATSPQPADDPTSIPQAESQASNGHHVGGPYPASLPATPMMWQAVPQYSPDGRSWWNGQQWVPVAPPAPGGKSKATAGILAILLGGLGIHKFYLGRTLMGLLYFFFCWTFIPGVVGLVEGIIYLTLSDEEFERRYGTPGRAR